MISEVSSSGGAMKTLGSKRGSVPCFSATGIAEVTKKTVVHKNTIRKQVRARAPLRLGFAGGGTDISPYSDEHGGFVVNASIDKYARTTITSRDDGLVELVAADGHNSWIGPASETLALIKGLELHIGVYNRIIKEFRIGEPLSISVVTHSEAPPGSGLGSSSTTVVALVKAFCEYLALPLAVYDIAHLAYEIERIDLRFPGGKQDQYAAAFGGLNFMEFYRDRVIVNPLRLKQDHLAELESSLMLFYTGVSRESSNIINEQVENMKGGNRISLQAMHDLKAEALHMKEALLKGDLDAVATAMQMSWAAKKKMATAISNPQINEIYEAAIEEGARAGKVSGAGGGGYMIFIVDPVKASRVVRRLNQFSGCVSACNFVEQGVNSWRVR
jgi:D-glycero-alpha-D-manno-heptose-7-phosphate kinase